jgi:4-hydroxy-tetrahydrodipicolinate synthase
MSLSERLSLFEVVSTICKKLGCPFAFGISATTTHDIVALASKAIEVGAHGIMLGLPPYLRLCQEEIIEYVKSVRALVPANVPILLYNNIMRNSYGASPETVVHLHQEGIIWGVKHASVDFLADCQQIFSLDPTIRLYTGSDVMIRDLMTNPAYPCKFYGLTSILGNLFPTALAEMVADFVMHRPGEETGAVSKKSIEQRQILLKQCGDAVLTGCTLPVGVKHALKLKGIPGGETRRPIGYLSEAKKEEIRASVESFEEFCR